VRGAINSLWRALGAMALLVTVPALAEAPDRTLSPLSLEFAALPVITVQQVEGPGRDDLLTNDVGLTTYLSAGYAVLDWLEPALTMQFDAGSVRRAVFDRPGADGTASEAQLVEGSYWELWVTLMLRARYEQLFAEVGWAPLILRHDTSRVDLPNTAGEAGGTFVGSRSIAWTLGLGGTIPLADDLDLTLRLQFRIRYLVERGGKALAGEEESGQMLVWPLVGLSWRP
jgi:hypothetical protein